MKCTAQKSNGEPCNAWAIKGGNVCRVHGGSAPQVKKAAERRLLDARDSALAELKRMIDKGELDPKVALEAVTRLTELTETLGGRVARREEVQVEDVNETRDALERKLDRLAAEQEEGVTPEFN